MEKREHLPVGCIISFYLSPFLKCGIAGVSTKRFSKVLRETKYESGGITTKLTGIADRITKYFTAVDIKTRRGMRLQW